MEYLDIYDKYRNPTGQQHVRGNALPPDEYVLATAVWLVTPEGKILVTLRDSQKKVYPNTWENSGGAVLAGETTRQAVARELREETGIKAAPEAFDFLVTSINPPMFFDTYGLRKDIVLADVVLETGETAAARLVTVKELEQMMEKGLFAKPIEQQLRLHWPLYYDYFTHFESGE